MARLMTWTERAACRNLADADSVFFTDDGPGAPALYKQARAVCAACPVRQECLEFAIENNERYGVWGGLTPLERKAHKREAS